MLLALAERIFNYTHLKPKKMKVSGLLLLCITMLLTSCEVIGGIFKAGVWTGILAVGIVVFLIIFLIARGSGKK